jgi:hypothetical protein
MTLGIARTSMITKKAVLVGHWEKRAPFDPDVCVEEFAEILKAHRLTTVTGDRYSAEWVISRFRSHGIAYVNSEKTKSEIYLEFLALVNSGRVKIPSSKRLRAQLVGLERRTSRAGRDTVDHAVGAKDDVANAVCGALCLAAKPTRKFFVPQVLFFDPQKGKLLEDPFLELPHDKWHKLN